MNVLIIALQFLFRKSGADQSTAKIIDLPHQVQHWQHLQVCPQSCCCASRRQDQNIQIKINYSRQEGLEINLIDSYNSYFLKSKFQNLSTLKIIFNSCQSEAVPTIETKLDEIGAHIDDLILIQSRVKNCQLEQMYQHPAHSNMTPPC